MKRIFRFLSVAIVFGFVYSYLADFFESFDIVPVSNTWQFIVILYIVLLIHEFGHIIMFRAFGVKLGYLRIGIGFPIIKYKRFELCIIPFEGRVWAEEGSMCDTWKYVLILLGGSLFELLVAMLIFSYSRLFVVSGFIAELIVILLVTGIGNLIPFERDLDGYKVFVIFKEYVKKKFMKNKEVIQQDT